MNPEKPLSPVCISATLGSLVPTDRQDSVNDRQVWNGSKHNTRVSAPVRIGLVDSFAFTRECLIETLTTPEHGFIVTAFDTMSKLIVSGVREIDVILYYDREQEGSRTLDASWGTEIGGQYGGVPIIVLSDTTALQPQTVRAALKNGVRGFISTQTFEIRTASAAIRFVMAGGVFAPVDLLLADGVVPTSDRIEAPPDGLLTPRQITVLSLVQQGKANKIIAYELGMSESTVKVHIRNIMRKMGATNRTQVIYKLQQLSRQTSAEPWATNP